MRAERQVDVHLCWLGWGKGLDKDLMKEAVVFSTSRLLMFGVMKPLRPQNNY
jgi:hypothetical protein